jgi:hypothetical protein
MLRTLLAERFGLKVHTETRDLGRDARAIKRSSHAISPTCGS